MGEGGGDKRKKEFADKSSRARRARRDAVRKLFFSLTAPRVYYFAQRWAKLSTHLAAEGREKNQWGNSHKNNDVVQIFSVSGAPGGVNALNDLGVSSIFVASLDHRISYMESDS